MYFNNSSFSRVKYTRSSAWLEHAPFALWLTEVLQPKRIVELGTHNGFSFLTFCQAIKMLHANCTAFAIDTWQGDDHAGFYSNDVYEQLEAEVRINYPGIAILVRSTFDDARGSFQDGSVDLLHIDGRHRYDDVKNDFERWVNVLSSSGVVLFHDTRVQKDDFGVWKFWGEIQAQYPSFEFYHGNGLGMLLIGKDTPKILQNLCQEGFDNSEHVRQGYERLGASNTLAFQILSMSTQITQSELNKRHLIHQVEELSQQLSGISHSLRMQQDVSESLRAEYNSKVDEFSSLAKEHQTMLAHNEKLETDMERLSQLNHAIVSSSSWKITRPYRYIGEKIRSIRR